MAISIGLDFGPTASRIKRDRERLLKLLTENQMVTAPQMGPERPGEYLGDITAPQEGTGLLPEPVAGAVASLIANPQSRGVGQTTLQQLLNRAFPQGQDPTTFERNMQALGIDLNTEEGRAIGTEIYTKRGGTFFPTGRILSKGEAEGMGLDGAETWWLDPQTGPKKLGAISDTQRAASGFAVRMNSASKIINSLETSGGFDPTAASEHVEKVLPFSLGDNISNFFKSPQGQQYRQAAMNWIRANLRKESGAVISQEEFAEEFRTYFPQPGDGPDVVIQKRRAREDVERNMKKQGGQFYQKTFGDLSGPTPPPGFVIEE